MIVKAIVDIYDYSLHETHAAGDVFEVSDDVGQKLSESGVCCVEDKPEQSAKKPRRTAQKAK